MNGLARSFEFLFVVLMFAIAIVANEFHVSRHENIALKIIWHIASICVPSTSAVVECWAPFSLLRKGETRAAWNSEKKIPPGRCPLLLMPFLFCSCLIRPHEHFLFSTFSLFLVLSIASRPHRKVKILCSELECLRSRFKNNIRNISSFCFVFCSMSAIPDNRHDIFINGNERTKEEIGYFNIIGTKEEEKWAN